MSELLCFAEPDVFDSFVDALWSALCPDAPVPAEAIGERPAGALPISFAINRSKRFAAFRWWQPGDLATDVRPGLVEAFCLPSATHDKLRLGVRHSPAGSQEPGIAALQSWMALQRITPGPAEKPLPGFVELAALLASDGLVNTSSFSVLQTLDAARAELEHSQAQLREQEDELRRLRAKLREMRSLPWVAGERATEDTDESDYPDTLDNLEGWAGALSGRLTILPRAFNGAKKSIYERPELVFTGLEFLAGAYRDYRLGQLSLAEMEKALNATSLRIAGSISLSAAGAQGESYFVAWNGRRRFLDLHLLRGGGRDERYCMRIYFFWDDETQQCVVGWLPSHLDNSLT